MNQQVSHLNDRLVTGYRLFTIIAATVIFSFGLAVAIGWVFDIDLLKRPIAQGSLVHGSVALALVLSAMSLIFITLNITKLRIIGQSLGAILAICGALTFLEDMSGLDLGLNHTWWQAQPDSAGLTFPGPMAPNVALSFFLLGLSLFLFGLKSRGNSYPFQYFALSGWALSAMALIGHSCGVAYLCTLVGCIKMPLAASIALLMLATAILLAAPELGMTEIFVKQTTGGKITRRCACFVIILPILLWLNRLGEKSGLWDAAFGWTTFAVLVILLAIACISWNAKTLDAIESARSEAENRLEKLTIAPASQVTGGQRLRFKTICPICSQDYPHELELCPRCGTELSRVAEDPLVGTIFADRYEILSLLGSGGMSSVYKAKHTTLGKVLAIKLMLSHMASNVKAVKRFKQEAKAASQLSHPNLIMVHDFGFTQEGEPYLVMDYVDGASLADLLDQSLLEVDRAVTLFVQICDGLYHAHQNGVIHRDLKPDNIMIVNLQNGTEQVKIVDFGLAKELALEMSEKVTRTGEIFGTPHYMSPEQCLGQTADCRADIYALGCIMYECFVGHPPFDSESPMEVIRMHLARTPEPFSWDLKIPDWLSKEIFRCLAKDQNLRPQSLKELRDSLDAKGSVHSAPIS